MIIIETGSMSYTAGELDQSHNAMHGTYMAVRGADHPTGISHNTIELMNQGADLVHQLTLSAHLEANYLRTMVILFKAVGAGRADAIGRTLPLLLHFTEVHKPKKIPWYLKPFAFGKGIDDELWAQAKNLGALAVMAYVLNPANAGQVQADPKMRAQRDKYLEALKALYHHPGDIIKGLEYNTYGDLGEDARKNGGAHAAGMAGVRGLEMLSLIANVTKLSLLAKVADIQAEARAGTLTEAEAQAAIRKQVGTAKIKGLKVADGAEELAAVGDIRTMVRTAADKAFEVRRNALQNQMAAAKNVDSLDGLQAARDKVAAIQARLDRLAASQKEVHHLTEGRGALATDTTDLIARSIEKGTEQGAEERAEQREAAHHE